MSPLDNNCWHLLSAYSEPGALLRASWNCLISSSRERAAGTEERRDRGTHSAVSASTAPILQM